MMEMILLTLNMTLTTMKMKKLFSRDWRSSATQEETNIKPLKVSQNNGIKQSGSRTLRPNESSSISNVGIPPAEAFLRKAATYVTTSGSTQDFDLSSAPSARRPSHKAETLAGTSKMFTGFLETASIFNPLRR
jgi:hypothetical protein